jgi:NTP pyrophosphatase (non-canonical NTP hydrolase)
MNTPCSNHEMDEPTFDELAYSVKLWAESRELIKKENVSRQMLKLMEEVGETAASIARGNRDLIKDGIGDSFVTLIILSWQNGIDPTECLRAAWEEIKDRKGTTQNGVFIKQRDND